MNAWIFDIDGVLTNISSMDIEKPQLLDYVSRILDKDPLALITGRRFSWVNETVLERLNFDENQLRNLFVASEFGIVTAFYQDNSLIKLVDDGLKTPTELIEKASAIIEKFSKTYEAEEKETMFTAKTRENIPRNRYEEIKTRATEELKTLLIDPQYKNFEVFADSTAVNIRNIRANKRHGIQRLLDWLNNHDMNPDSYIIFGDNPSDLEMGEELFNQGREVKFIFVGDAEIGDYPFELIKTKNKFDEGALEYLASHPRE
jgi:HAD superfamily hydrolase (TIGR01484 family)